MRELNQTILGISFLSAISGGCNNARRLRSLYKLTPEQVKNRVFALRRAGYLKPYKGGRDFSLSLTPQGQRILAGVVHGLRKLNVQKAEEKA